MTSAAPDRLASFSEIPRIDIAASGDAALRPRLAAALVGAAEEVGFMYVTGHGIDPDLLDAVFEQARAFFALPIAARRRIGLEHSTQFRGYMGVLAEGTDPSHVGNILEAFQCHEELAPDHPDVVAGLPLRGPNQWPDGLPGFRDVTLAYFEETRRLGFRLLELLAEGLGQPSDFFARHYERPLGQLRLLRYPPQERIDESGRIGVRAHADAGVITILTQDDTGGLEVMNKDGAWIAAPPLRHAYLINIGNTLQFWSGGRMSSTRHRVINCSGTYRYSVPFFMNPDYETIVRPLGRESDPDAPRLHAGEELLATYRRLWPVKAA